MTVGPHNLAMLMSAPEIRYIGSENGIGTSFGAHNSVGTVTLSSLFTDGIYSRLFVAANRILNGITFTFQPKISCMVEIQIRSWT